MSPISRGEIWLANFNPTRGHEQSGIRPALVVSVDLFNRGPAGVVIAIPITSTDRRVLHHVEVRPPEGGLRVRSFVRCEDVRSMSVERLIRPLGKVETQTLAEIEDRLRILMGL